MNSSPGTSIRLLGAVLAFSLGIASAHARDKLSDAAFESAHASPSVVELSKRYPAGTINSDELASQALADVKKERADVEARLRKAQVDCSKNFLVTKCRDAAKDRRRQDRQQIKLVENEAAKYQRQAKVIKRDEALAEKREKEEAGAGKRAEKQEKFAEKEAARAASADSSLSTEVKPGAVSGSASAPASKQSVLSPQERAANVEAYEKKLSAVEDNEQKVAERKAKNDKKRAKKKADAAAAKEKEKAAAAAAKAGLAIPPKLNSPKSDGQ